MRGASRWPSRTLAVLCVLFTSLEGAPIEVAVTSGLTSNNNITLLSRELNFGPEVADREDDLAHLDLDLDHKRKGLELHYTFNRTQFFKNSQLHFFHHVFRGAYEVSGWADSHYRVQTEVSQFDPDQVLQPDILGNLPFTTTELPGRRVLQLEILQALTRRDYLLVQALDQSHRYINNPLIDNDATGAFARYTRVLKPTLSAFVEVGGDRKGFPNLLSPEPDRLALETRQEVLSGGLFFAHGPAISGLVKVSVLDQEANLDAFDLHRVDVSTILGHNREDGTTNVLVVQHSRRTFPRRLVPDRGTNQDDTELLANLIISRRLLDGIDGRLSASWLRSASNDPTFEFVNRILRVELVWRL